MTSPEEDMSLFNFAQEKNAHIEPRMQEDMFGDKASSGIEEDILDHIPDHIEGSPLEQSFVPPDIAPPKQPQEIPQDFDPIELIDDIGKDGKVSSATEPAGGAALNGQNKQWIPEEKFKESHFPDEFDPSIVHEKKQAEQSMEAVVSDLSKAPRQVPREDSDELLNIFFKAAGMEDKGFLSREEYPEIMRTVGVVFRELIEGLMTVLRGRTELKSQFRVPLTTIRPTENNPLKFSPNVDEALKLLLKKDHPGFVDAIDAVREGYQDVMNHQLAITAGIQASLMKLLKRFDPQKFVKQYEEGIVFQKKAKCWDAYNQEYCKIVEEALENFFGDEFAQAYEKQMLKLRATLNKS
jgi:type VI secretion system protein ImpI/type VI secretion system protein